MYRLLEIGEVIESGDEYWACFDWRVTEQNEIGDKIESHHTPHRRLVKADVTPAADENEGYRMLSVGEKIRAGDEIYVGKWEVVVKTLVGTTMQDWDKSKVRRRIPQPAPVVSVGDRVAVLSGIWAGCTGVVDVPWGKLNYNTCSFDLEAVSVRLGNVFVGGNQLVIVCPVSQVEKLPLVVAEVVYRDLAHDEVIRQGDEFLNGFDSWLPVVSIGAKWDNYYFRPMRRPVRIQSPGWRYLDAGETVQAGDETFCENVGFWPLSIVNGSQLNNERMFRRKLSPNVGG